MDLAGLSIKRPIFISCLVIIMLLVGGISLKLLSVDLFPDVTFPTVVVNTPYPGAGPAEVETLVSQILEEEISGVSGIEKLRSTSKEGMSQVIAEFTLKTNIKYAEQQIRDRVSTAKRKLPDDIEEPTIRTVDPSDQPIAVVSVTADLSPAELYDLADEVVKPKLEQVPDVGLVEILGGRKREIQVQVDQNKLRYYEISANQVSEALAKSGKNVPAGKISGAGMETVYRTVAQFSDMDMIKNAIVRFTGNELPVRVQDIGKVIDTLEDEKSRTFVDTKPSLLLMVFRQSGANTIAVVDNVKAAVVKLNERSQGQAGAAKFQVVRDGAKRIRANVFDVYEAIIIGIILTIIVVYFFLGSMRSTVITGLALPNSLLGAFILMLIAGFSVNIMSLLALSLAVGLLIDDAIVVRENIFRHLEMGKSPERAALDGTKEVSLAVIATTLAILAVFGPIAFLQGVVGQFFKEFGMTICFAMLISLFDALTIAPMLSAYFAGNHYKEPTSAIGRLNKRMVKAFDRFQTWLEDGYEVLLHGVLRWPMFVLGFNVILFVGSLYLGKYIPKTFLPPQDNGEFVVAMDLPPGTNLDAMTELTQKVDAVVRGHKEVLRTVVTVGSRDGEANFSEIAVELVPGKERELSTSAMKAVVRKDLKVFAHAKPQVKDPDGASGGGQRPFNVNLTGENLQQLEALSLDLVARIKDHPALKDADTSYRPGKPEFQIVINPEMAAQAGVNTAVVGNELRTLVEGTTPALFREGGREYDIRVRAQEDQRDLDSEFSKMMVPNINNNLVRLPMISKGVEAKGPANIRREDRARYVQVSADIDPKGTGLGGALTDVKRILSEDMKLPEGVGFSFVGQAERFQELMMNMMIASLLGVLFIYFVLASLYESFITPLAIMLVLPLAIMGVFVALFVSRSTLDLYSMIGCVMLLGLATKNSILMVDYTNQLMKQGVERSKAVIQAGKTRLRPILMTTFALIAGMIPVAIGLNEASKQRTSLGIAVIGGTISSTLLTLVVVPAAYAYIDRFKNWVDGIFNRYVRGHSDPGV
ncbi:MAG: efflux RND transporter permease subunit, partial [Pseudobdellovibrionaceae bacterium]